MSKRQIELYNQFFMDFMELEDQPPSSQSLDEVEREQFKESANVVVRLVQVRFFFSLVFCLPIHLGMLRTSLNASLTVVVMEVTLIGHL
jgi:hypothetical protein